MIKTFTIIGLPFPQSKVEKAFPQAQKKKQFILCNSENLYIFLN